MDSILLKEKFIFKGTIEELSEKIILNNNQKFRTEWLEYNRFKFFAKWSLGTLMITYFPGAIEGIKGYVELKQIGENKTEVCMNTKVRIELYVFLIVLSIVFIAGLTTKSDFSVWIVLLTPVVLLWFWFVYRLQEKLLFKKLRNYLTEEKTHYNKT